MKQGLLKSHIKGKKMTTFLKTTHDDSFEKSVYVHFPKSSHEFVKTALYYHGYELETGEITMQEFESHVSGFAVMQSELEKQRIDALNLFEGIRKLVADGEIKSTRFVKELSEELSLGTDSMLAWFIISQPLKSPMDAAVSFLAWNHTRALFELEEECDVSLDDFRDQRDHGLFGTSESEISMVNFSTLSH